MIAIVEPHGKDVCYDAVVVELSTSRYKRLLYLLLHFSSVALSRISNNCGVIYYLYYRSSNYTSYIMSGLTDRESQFVNYCNTKLYGNKLPLGTITLIWEGETDDEGKVLTLKGSENWEIGVFQWQKFSKSGQKLDLLPREDPQCAYKYRLCETENAS